MLTISPEDDLYLGLSGIDLQFEQLDLGEGIRLAKTKSVLLGNYMMVFESLKDDGIRDRPMRKDEDGSTWINVTRETKPLPGLQEYRISAELHIPKAASARIGRDAFHLARWVVALMRIWSAPSVTATVISKLPLAVCDMKELEDLQLFPFETQARGIYLESHSGRSVTEERLCWVRDSWLSGGRLANERKEFRLAVEALDQAHFIPDHALGLLLVWAALEGLFSPTRSELRFRVSSLIASFLEPPGPQRKLVHSEVMKLYDKRSSAAHDRSSIDRKALFDSMSLLRRIVIKILSDSHVPSRDELEALLFGG